MAATNIIGIDLGTTNSLVAIMQPEGPEVIEENGEPLLPSCVGLTPGGELLVGRPARNQWMLYPERTVLSIKRKMGSSEQVTLGTQSFTPQEISAIILRALADRAKQALGTPIERAVITVPAYFSDAQRQATREAGALAGLEVMRLLHEPTAAALAYGAGDAGRTVMVYDLGGGTFDVSIVRIDGDITEVLSSHGDTHLGGDDLDQLLVDEVAERFREGQGVDPRTEPRALARLRRAVEEARCRLSFESSVMLREEALVTRGRTPLHLELELTRSRFESLARPLIQRTLDSVHRALSDARLSPRKLDGVLLAGGATRTPLVLELLREHLGQEPRRELHPDLCVAEGAALLASRLAGQDTRRILVDVTPYSFGPAHLGERDGRPYPYCFKPVIPRNTPLPVSRTEAYYTIYDGQEGWSVQIFQGDDPDALKNILIGHFMADGFSNQPAGNKILCRMDLDPDGILRVTVTEEKTGQSKHVTIENAMATLDAEALAAARLRLLELMGTGEAVDGGMLEGDLESALQGAEGLEEEEWEEEEWEEEEEEEAERGEAEEEEEAAALEAGAEGALSEGALEEHHRPAGGPVGGAQTRGRFAAAHALVEQTRGLLERMHREDEADARELMARIERSIETEDLETLDRSTTELSDLLFYVEAR